MLKTYQSVTTATILDIPRNNFTRKSRKKNKGPTLTKEAWGYCKLKNHQENYCYKNKKAEKMLKKIPQKK